MKLLTYTFFLALSVVSMAQACVEVTAGFYAGKTLNGSLDKYGSSNTTISTNADDELVLDDFSAGFFAQFNKSPIQMTMEVDCEGNITSKEVESFFGTIYIESGHYSADSSQLTLIWSIPQNHVNEKSIFTKN